MSFDRQTLLDTARASPTAVAAHDRAAWLALFSDSAEIQDPVGSRPHRSREQRERFYATFIAPNQIRFEVDHDVVCGQTVVRDVVIHTAMGDTGLAVAVPLHIFYDIANQAGRPRVTRLHAHWELWPMLSGEVFKAGAGVALPAMWRLSLNMLRHQGLGGAMGFSRALFGVGQAAKQAAEIFLAAASRGELTALDASIHCELPAGTALSGQDAATALLDISWHKMIAAGRQVTASIALRGQRGVALFDFANDNRRFERLRIYLDA